MISSSAFDIIMGQLTSRMFVVVLNRNPFLSRGSRIVASKYGNQENIWIDGNMTVVFIKQSQNQVHCCIQIKHEIKATEYRNS